VRTSARRAVLLWLCFSAFPGRCSGQSATPVAQTSSPVQARITQAIDQKNLITLSGNVHPLGRPEFDQGPVSDAQPLHRMLLLLQRSPEQEAALGQLLEDQQRKSSANYQNWITPNEFGQRFGPAEADIQTISQWLASEGFSGIKVAAGRMVLEFSGTAGQVRVAFHTEIHQYAVKESVYFANANDPRIPASLASVVAGIVSLHNFPVKSHLHRLGTFQKLRNTGETKPLFTFPGCQSGNCFALGPPDFATIYNTAPLLNGSPKTDGTGQGIAVVGESNIDVQDVVDFRTIFGLPQNFSSANVILNGPIQAKTSRKGNRTWMWNGPGLWLQVRGSIS
jgi:subtilase family serine protease